LGLFMAVELRDPVRNQDFPPGLHVADQVTAATMQMGLFGPRPLGGSTLVFAPPLIFTEAQAEQAVDLLDTALRHVESTILATAVAQSSEGRQMADRPAPSRRFLHLDNLTGLGHFGGLAVVEGKALPHDADSCGWQTGNASTAVWSKFRSCKNVFTSHSRWAVSHCGSTTRGSTFVITSMRPPSNPPGVIHNSSTPPPGCLDTCWTTDVHCGSCGS
jgi:hypothetical protein